jgi:hypothetical protein
MREHSGALAFGIAAFAAMVLHYINPADDPGNDNNDPRNKK